MITSAMSLEMFGYGCTELSPVCAVNTPDLVCDGFRVLANRTGTIGPPLPGCSGRIVHPETAELLPVGEEGMLLVYGANVMKGYLHKEELTSRVLLEGWYVTGDMGRFDADGFLTLTGRLSRFAKVGGEMVPLERIEEELHDLLQTNDRVCSVTCVPDDSRGERLVVLYVNHQKLEVSAWCRQLLGRGLPNLWVPSERDFYPIPELPVLGSGKVDLKRIKELALELARR
jgi:acyl-[acyl-carrier-protein]-phospholipid O-acyltransferase/long-chain-fatty-acid--[acyl-carrier-protein] ligase